MAENNDSINTLKLPTEHGDNQKLKSKKKTRKSKEMNRGGSMPTHNSVATPNGDKIKATTKTSDRGLHM